MNKRLLVIFLILLSGTILFPGFQNPPSQPEENNARIKSVFIYNFTKYIEWPETYSNGTFIITLFGENKYLYAELQKMAATKSVGEQNIEIRRISHLDAMEKSNILFVLPENSHHMTEIVSRLKGQSTLLITEKPGMIKQGAVINFIVQDNKQKFELSKANAEKFNLKISSNLISLAIKAEK